MQQKAVRHSQELACTPITEGKPCVVSSQASVPGKICPCADGLTCAGNPACLKCLRKDGQFCTSDAQCAGGVCAGNLYHKGGLCKSRMGSLTINLTDVSGGIVDENPQFKEAFAKAAARYSAILRGQVVIEGDITVYILYSVEPIDGPGGILGFAGPTYVTGADVVPYGLRWLSTNGIMVFDVEDLLSPQFAPLAETIILHEMAHVLGIGTLQEPSVVIRPIPGFKHYDMTDCEKRGDGRYNSLDGFATTAYLYSKGYLPTGLGSNFTRARVPPIETEFGPGTRCGHWDEGTLVNELLTGFVGDEEDNPLSIITIAGFEDLGYVVDYEMADPYTVPVSAAVLSASARGSRTIDIDKNIMHPTIGYTAPGQRMVQNSGKTHTEQELQGFRAKFAKTGTADASP